MKPPLLEEGSAGIVPTLRRIPWHLPYNWGKITEKPQSRVMRYDKLRLVRFIVLCRSSIQILFVLRSVLCWMWRRLLVCVSEMVTSLVAMHTGRHTPYAIVTTEVGLRVKSQVGVFACHGNQMAVAVVKRCVFSKRSAWLWGRPILLIIGPFPGSRATGTWDWPLTSV